MHFDEPIIEDVTLAAVMAALSDPVRVAIVRELAAEGERTCGTFELGDLQGHPLASLPVLREAGLTHTRAEGTHRHVSLRRDEVDARFPGLLGAVLAAAEREAALPRSPPDRLVGHLHQQLRGRSLADDLGLDLVGHAALLPGDRRRRARAAAAQRLVAALAALGERHLAAPERLAALLGAEVGGEARVGAAALGRGGEPDRVAARLGAAPAGRAGRSRCRSCREQDRERRLLLDLGDGGGQQAGEQGDRGRGRWRACPASLRRAARACIRVIPRTRASCSPSGVLGGASPQYSLPSA